MGGRSTFSRAARSHPLSAFYLLAFAITWGAWLPQAAHARGLLPVDIPLLYLVGGVGPGVAAWIVLRALHGDAGERALVAPLLRWRVPARWYVVAVVLPVAVWLLAVVVAGRGNSITAGTATGLAVAFVTYLVAAVPEEVGWRGFALPRLQSRHGALTASLVVGVLGGLWHLPLLWNPDNVMSTYPVLPWFAGIVALSVVYTWLFNSTGGSVLVVTVFHAGTNTAAGLTVGYLATETLLTAAVAVALVLLFGAAHLSHRPRVRSVEPAVPLPGRATPDRRLAPPR